MPSFHEMRFIRKLKDKSDYFFLDTQLIVLDDSAEPPVLGVCGRIVKNTMLRREQIFRPRGGLIEDKSALETAPSSTFLLILNNHRLILSPEVPNAPTIQNFRSTSQYCLKTRHREFIQEEFDEGKAARSENPDHPRVTKTNLLREYPVPNLRITPLPSQTSLSDFLGRLERIEKVTIKLLPTNQEEIDNDGFWSEFGRRRHEMNSASTKVEFTNSQETLDQTEVYKQVSSASSLGNSEIDFKGYDQLGDTIRGDNNDFDLTVEVEEISKDVAEAARKKYDKFLQLLSSNIVSLPAVTAGLGEKIRRVFDIF